jgi:hypothetical protein
MMTSAEVTRNNMLFLCRFLGIRKRLQDERSKLVDVKKPGCEVGNRRVRLAENL